MPQWCRMLLAGASLTALLAATSAPAAVAGPWGASPAAVTAGPLGAARDTSDGTKGEAAPALSAVVIGDSLTDGAQKIGAFSDRLTDAGLRVLGVDAAVGRTTDRLEERLRAVAKRQGGLPDVIVIALGTNDAVALRSDEQILGNIATAMELIGPDRPVFWVDVDLGAKRRDAARADHVNDLLRAAAATHPNLRIVAWQAVMATNSGLRRSDGVHLSAEGYRFRAAAIAGEIARDVRGLEATRTAVALAAAAVSPTVRTVALRRLVAQLTVSGPVPVDGARRG